MYSVYWETSLQVLTMFLDNSEL